jgi:hypothetical protein
MVNDVQEIINICCDKVKKGKAIPVTGLEDP